MTLYPTSLRQFLTALAALWSRRKGCPICTARTHGAEFHTAHERAAFMETRSHR